MKLPKQLTNGEKTCISIKLSLKGPSLQQHKYKAIVTGLGHFNIDVSNKVNLSFLENERVKLQAFFQKDEFGLILNKVYLIRKNNRPIDITMESKSISNIHKFIEQEYMLNKLIK